MKSIKPQTFHELLKSKLYKHNDLHDPKTGRFAPKGGAGSVSSISLQMERDVSAISGKIQYVRDSVSNETKTLSRKGANIDKIMKDGGCDRATAEKAAAEAKTLYDRMAKAEPVITSDIVGAVGANNGKMFGLDHRMKQETSLGRKIAKEANENFDGDLKAAAADIKDACRYTAVFETSGFTQGYKNVKASLEAKGYTEERCKNYYQRYKEGNSQQKAVQCVYSDKNGNRLELQFHTYESQGAKEVNHPLYESFRAASTSKVKQNILDNRMINISSNVPDPEGVYDIKAH